MRRALWTWLGVGLVVLCGCGGSSNNNSQPAVPPPVAAEITISNPNPGGQVTINGSPGAVAGMGTVTATNMSQSATTMTQTSRNSSWLEGVAEADGSCTPLTATVNANADGSFSNLIICANSGDTIGLKYTNTSGRTSSVTPVTAPGPTPTAT